MFKERQKIEAIRRIERLKLHENVLNEFKKENKLNISRVGGVLFWLSEKEQNIIDKFEQESGNLVYHVLYNKMEFGELYTFFYISKNEDEWDLDMEDLDNNIALTYGFNMTNESLSEYGYIRFKRCIEGLVRIS